MTNKDTREVFYHLTVEETALRLGVVPAEGLSTEEASRRLAQYGANELLERGGRNPLRILWEQIINPLVLLLIGAAALSFYLGKVIDAGAVMAIVVLNSALGFIQEYRAERAMAALKRMSNPLVRVLRDGRISEVPAREVVPGDVLLLEAGNSVPADARVIESASLRVQEAALTGESQPVDKVTQALAGEDIPLGDRHNLLFMGTAVSYGRGRALVTATGMRTELGKVADLIQNVKSEETPLQRRMGQLGRGLALAVLGIVAVAFGIGLAIGEDSVLMFQTAISMAVAAVPEGLPAVVTIVLGFGAQRMLRRKALIRKLPAVETLGSVTAICSDKTGTLTQNRMTVTVLDVANHTLRLDEILERGKPVLLRADQAILPQWPAHTLMLAGGALCNDALLQPGSENAGDFHSVGDPTEAALVVAAARLGMWKDRLEHLFPRVAEVPFTSERKRMSTLHRVRLPADLLAVESPLAAAFGAVPYVLFAKGGVDSLLGEVAQVWVDGRVLPMDAEWKGRVLASSEALAAQGLRVLAVAFRPLQDSDLKFSPGGEIVLAETDETDLTLVGMVGMMDPPRLEVPAAVHTCQAAGIRPVMITGDHPLTARQIALMLNIVWTEDARVVTGQELAAMDDAALEALVGEVSVYARVSPEHKLRIVQALQKRGEVVAMTGDGVNDAPALRRADIGVGMGITGTDVAKEAASIVLLDDNFATIVSAVEEGRRVYENVRKFIRYTLGSNAGEILVMFFSPLLGLPLPLIPLQILWMNLVTDGVPGLALTTEPPEVDAMRRPPVSPRENIFSRGLGAYILRIGVVMAVITLAFSLITSAQYGVDSPVWKTMVFTLLIYLQAGHALAIRSDRQSIFRLPVGTNPAIYAAVALTLLIQLAAVYWQPLQSLFGTVALTGGQLLVTLAVSTLLLLWVELEKALLRRK